VTMRRCAVLPDAADYDADGDVDDADLAVFAAHENGPGNDPCDVTSPSVIPGWRSDFDGDGDVDGVDYIVFAHAYGGAGVDPRGDRMLLSGPMPASRVANPYFFTGRRLDLLDIDDANTPNHFTDDTARLPLYHYRVRTMDPAVGRFLQRDRVGYGEGMNPYEYVRSWPTVLLDPYGLESWEPNTFELGQISFLQLLEELNEGAGLEYGRIMNEKYQYECDRDVKFREIPCVCGNRPLHIAIMLYSCKPKLYADIGLWRIVPTEKTKNSATLATALAKVNFLLLQHELGHIRLMKEVYTAFDCTGIGASCISQNEAQHMADEAAKEAFHHEVRLKHISYRFRTLRYDINDYKQVWAQVAEIFKELAEVGL